MSEPIEPAGGGGGDGTGSAECSGSNGAQGVIITGPDGRPLLIAGGGDRVLLDVDGIDLTGDLPVRPFLDTDTEPLWAVRAIPETPKPRQP